MFKVKLDKNKILESLHTEEELFDLSTLESIYQIRILKTLIHYEDKVFLVEKINEHGQAFVEDFEIWVHATLQD